MKVTVDINLGGDVFHVDEDAYQGLRHYLTSLERAFAEEDGAGEIIADIEGRMGELFKVMAVSSPAVALPPFKGAN